jgi:hypothetical protein
MKGLVIKFKRRNSKKSKKHSKRLRKTRRVQRGGNYYEGASVVEPLDPREDIDGSVPVLRTPSNMDKIDEVESSNSN